MKVNKHFMLLFRKSAFTPKELCVRETQYAALFDTALIMFLPGFFHGVGYYLRIYGLYIHVRNIHVTIITVFHRTAIYLGEKIL